MERQFLTLEEMAEQLGIKPSTIYATTSPKNRVNPYVKVSHNIPPWIKRGSRILFPVEDYLKWKEEQKRHVPAYAQV